MPYISEKDRNDVLERGIGPDSGPGKLAYAVTMTVKAFLGTKPRFADYAAALGVLEAVKLELYRRQIAPYEDQKIKENGDVYECTPPAPCPKHGPLCTGTWRDCGQASKV